MRMLQLFVVFLKIIYQLFFDNGVDMFFTEQSIQFHENGKRHQVSVAKRLVDIKKNSVIERKEEQRMEMDMKRMEQVT